MKKGQIVWAELENILRDSPALVSCMQVNNETGAMPDLDRLIQCVRSASPQALIHVDGVQGFLRLPFDARKVDLYTLSSHKIHGPKGVGALYVKSGVRLVPRQMGGGQENAVRSGTENTPGIAGLMRAIEEMEAHTDRVPALYALKGKFWALVQKEAPEAVLNGPGIRSRRAPYSQHQLSGGQGRGHAARPGGGRSLLFHGFRLFQQKAQAEPGAAEHGLKRRFGRGRAQVQPFDSYHG